MRDKGDAQVVANIFSEDDGALDVGAGEEKEEGVAFHSYLLFCQ